MLTQWKLQTWWRNSTRSCLADRFWRTCRCWIQLCTFRGVSRNLTMPLLSASPIRGTSKPVRSSTGTYSRQWVDINGWASSWRCHGVLAGQCDAPTGARVPRRQDESHPASRAWIRFCSQNADSSPNGIGCCHWKQNKTKQCIIFWLVCMRLKTPIQTQSRFSETRVPILYFI